MEAEFGSDGRTTLGITVPTGMYTVLLDGRLLTTETGQLGLGPQTMEPEHIVVILYGLQLPAVLNYLDPNQNPNRHGFIGACFMHGIMDGAAVDVHRQARNGDAVFNLL